MSTGIAHPAEPHVSEIIRLSSGIRHHYTRTEGSGPPILFLHGFLDSSLSFDALIRNFPQPVRSFSLDQRGHGESESGKSYAISDFASDGIEFIERVIGTPAVVVGHSLGSIVAQRIAALRPDLVSKLVLIAAAPTAGAHPELAELRNELAKFHDRVPRPFVEEFQRSTVYAPISEAAINGYIDESSKVSIETWKGALDGLLDEPASHVHPVTVPTLVVWGTHDGVFGEKAQNELAALLPHHRAITYDDAGHAPHWEFPIRVGRDIDEFVRETWVG